MASLIHVPGILLYDTGGSRTSYLYVASIYSSVLTVCSLSFSSVLSLLCAPVRCAAKARVLLLSTMFLRSSTNERITLVTIEILT